MLTLTEEQFDRIVAICFKSGAELGFDMGNGIGRDGDAEIALMQIKMRGLFDKGDTYECAFEGRHNNGEQCTCE